MWTVYVLQSESSGRFYVGFSNDVDRRIVEHNSGQTKSTRGRGPWLLVYKEEFKDKTGAAARERQIKSWKSHRSIQELIEAQR